MSLWSRLRRFVERLLYAEADSDTRDCERLENEIERLRAVCALAIAEAERTELNLREALREDSDDALMTLVPQLERARDRARWLIEQYRQRESEAEQVLVRMGEVQRIERLNRHRQQLAEFMASAEQATGGDRVQELEDQARGEAIRLDVLDQLNHGFKPHQHSDERDLHDRARALLDGHMMEQYDND